MLDIFTAFISHPEVVEAPNNGVAADEVDEMIEEAPNKGAGEETVAVLDTDEPNRPVAEIVLPLRNRGAGAEAADVETALKGEAIVAAAPDVVEVAAAVNGNRGAVELELLKNDDGHVDLMLKSMLQILSTEKQTCDMKCDGIRELKPTWS